MQACGCSVWEEFCRTFAPHVVVAFWLMTRWCVFYALENRGRISYLHVFGKDRVCAVLEASSTFPNWGYKDIVREFQRTKMNSNPLSAFYLHDFFFFRSLFYNVLGC